MPTATVALSGGSVTSDAPKPMLLSLDPPDVEATVTLDYGDGSPTQDFTFAGGTGPNHQWPRGGPYTLTATVAGEPVGPGNPFTLDIGYVR